MKHWEFERCRRQPGGIHQQDLRRCLAMMEERLYGVHDEEGFHFALSGTLLGRLVKEGK